MSLSSIPLLSTSRLVLKPLTEADAPSIQKHFPHWEVLKYMASVIPWPYPDAGALDFIQRILPMMASGEEFYWGLFLRGEERRGLIGVIGLTPNDERDQRGFWLARDYWDRGYMTEAVAAVNDYAFDVLGLSELRLGNALPNVASHRLKEAWGAEIVSIDPNGSFVGGDFPTVRWRLEASSWRAAKAARNWTTTPEMESVNLRARWND